MWVVFNNSIEYFAAYF